MISLVKLFNDGEKRKQSEEEAKVLVLNLEHMRKITQIFYALFRFTSKLGCPLKGHATLAVNHAVSPRRNQTSVYVKRMLATTS